MTTSPLPSISPQDLQALWNDLLSKTPHLYTRNAANQLGVCEASLLASKVGDTVTRLRGPWSALLSEFEALGRVMALTRNNDAVHEKDGVYQNISIHGSTGLVLDKEIDLRVFFRGWHAGYAVAAPLARPKARRSLQFFNAQGIAVHKIFSTPETNLDAWDTLVTRHTHETQSPLFEALPKAEENPELPDDEIDVQGFRDAWTNLQDTHDFFPLLRAYKVSRTQALRLAPRGMAISVPTENVYALFAKAAATKTSMMVFVPSPGVLQIHSGPVHNIRRDASWFHVLDQGFSLHMRDEAMHSAWVVRKPTEDGVVTSMECFTQEGQTIALLFGERKPGIPEDPAWRALVTSYIE